MYIPILQPRKHFGVCPGCGLQNDVELDRCNHCNREFSKQDKLLILTYANEQKKKGTRLGIFFGLVLLFALGASLLL